jgi:hypothetical protein
MIFEISTWIYISVVCYAWGKIFLNSLLKKTDPSTNPGFVIVSFLGVCLLGILAMYCSIFFPLNGWLTLLFSLPPIYFYLSAENRKVFKASLKNLFSRLNLIDGVLLLFAVVIVLLLTISPIIHPDTLNYHVDSILIYKRFGQIPGIANVKLQFGFQSLWFSLLALFDFSMIQPNLSFPLNGVVICWFVLFLISNFTNNLFSNRRKFWSLLLFFIAMLSWTQIRLTVSSASPDFIVSVCVFLCLYYFIKTPEGQICATLSVFFSVVAVCIKLSAAPVLMIPFCLFVQGILKRDIKRVAGILIIGLIFLTPLVIRNLVSSGYPLYPSTVGDFFSFEWKLSMQKLIHLQHYITSYARYPVSFENADLAFYQTLPDWLPIWWQHQYLTDKFILLVAVAGLSLCLILFWKWIQQSGKYAISACLFSLIGTVFWFINAPDLRFGSAFVLPLIYFLYAPFSIEKLFSNPSMHFTPFRVLKWLAVLSMFCYIIYRGEYYFRADQILYPAGIMEAKMNSDCNSQYKKMLFTGPQTSFLVADSCKTFRFRTGFIKDGFKPSD